MTQPYKVENTTTADLGFVYQLFDSSITYQEERGYPTWRGYDKTALMLDVSNKNQYRIVIDSQIAIVFSVCYSDPIIWGERENNDSVYLHRIVINPVFKGQKLFGKILDWAIEHTRQKGRHFVRMDTWANNPNIIEYYKTFGFTFLDSIVTPDVAELPSHNRNIALALLELKLV